MEKVSRIEVTAPFAGKRLDKFLVEEPLHDYSRSCIQKLIVGGHIRVGGLQVRNNHKLLIGDQIEIVLPEPTETEIMAEDIPLKIAYEDKDLLVVDKPNGMVVHPAPGNYTRTLVNALLWYCKDLSGIGGVAKPGIVHRLDKGTTGLLVVAKNDKTHRSLAKQFKNKTTKRVYMALVKGVVEHDNGIVNLPVGRSSYDRKKMAIKFEEEEGRAAVTRFKVLERFKATTLLELILGTGRTHQIRVHMAHIGHPLVGDEGYGSRDTIGRPALHAMSLGFTHPGTKKFVEFTSELPDDIKEAIARSRAE